MEQSIQTRAKEGSWLSLFKIRIFAAGNVSGFLSSVARGGLQFMLIIWLQGVWLRSSPWWQPILPLPCEARDMSTT
jgi:hypothetical protein